jgi:uncharacterized protein YkwD
MYIYNMKNTHALIAIVFVFICQSVLADVDVNHARFMTYLNKYRAEHGAKPVVYDMELSKAAKIQATYNHANNKRNDLHQNHIYPDVLDRLNAAGIPTVKESYGEICYALRAQRPASMEYMASPYTNIEERMFEGYKNSKTGHAEIMRDKAYDKVGIHTIWDGKAVYNVVVFLTNKHGIRKPATAANASSPENVMAQVNSLRTKRMFGKRIPYLKYDKELETLAKNQAVFNMYHITHTIEDKTLSYKDLLTLNPNTQFSRIEHIYLGGAYDPKKPLEGGIDTHCMDVFKWVRSYREFLMSDKYTHMGVYSILDEKQGQYLYYIVVGTKAG